LSIVFFFIAHFFNGAQVNFPEAGMNFSGDEAAERLGCAFFDDYFHL